MKGMIRRQSDGKQIDCFYYPDVFHNVSDLEYAKRLTVTREEDLTSEMRWEIETKFTVDTLLRFILPSFVLDYGCGVGRLSKAFIDRTHCSVTGVDVSMKMLELAKGYVDNSRFHTCSSEELRMSHMRYDCAIAAWVLQHCLYPEMDIELISKMMKPKSYFMVLGTIVRKIPIHAPEDKSLCWMDDGVDIRKLTLKYFNLVLQGTFTPIELSRLNDGNYWAIYQRK